ncbi:MAG: hypothetical protein AAGJ55_03160 [Cyanobacteria bacterium J06555_12]
MTLSRPWLSPSPRQRQSQLRISVRQLAVHQIQVIVGKLEGVSQLAEKWLQPTRDLGQGVGLLPASKNLVEDVDELIGEGSGRVYPELDHLTRSLASMLQRESHAWRLAYLETEFFGGSGRQAAAVWDAQALIFGPKASESEWDSTNQIWVVDSGWPINEALRLIGVEADDRRDEFEALGLHELRSMDAFNAA